MPCKASRLESGVTLAAVRETVSLVPVGDRQQFEPIDTGGGTKILGGLGIDRNTTDLDRIDTQRLPDGRPPSNQLRFPDLLAHIRKSNKECTHMVMAMALPQALRP